MMLRLNSLTEPAPPAIAGIEAMDFVPKRPLWIFETLTVVTTAADTGFLRKAWM